jgi:hypothetical protein
MTPTNRRNLLLGSAAVVAGTSLGGMSGCPSSTVATILPTVIDDIQSTVATICGFVPDVATLLTILSVFPGIGGVATIASPLLTEVANFLCTAFKDQGGAPAAVAAAAGGPALSMKLKASTAPIHGLIPGPSGKIVKF